MDHVMLSLNRTKRSLICMTILAFLMLAFIALSGLALCLPKANAASDQGKAVPVNIVKVTPEFVDLSVEEPAEKKDFVFDRRRKTHPTVDEIVEIDDLPALE